MPVQFYDSRIIASTQSNVTVAASPSSCTIWRRSDAKPSAAAALTVTEKSTPTLRSAPDRSFGRIFVPRRFHTSGGTVPTSRSVRVLCESRLPAVMIAALWLHFEPFTQRFRRIGSGGAPAPRFSQRSSIPRQVPVQPIMYLSFGQKLTQDYLP